MTQTRGAKHKTQECDTVKEAQGRGTPPERRNHRGCNETENTPSNADETERDPTRRRKSAFKMLGSLGIQKPREKPDGNGFHLRGELLVEHRPVLLHTVPVALPQPHLVRHRLGDDRHALPDLGRRVLLKIRHDLYRAFVKGSENLEELSR